jgi:hypothetical protein
VPKRPRLAVVSADGSGDANTQAPPIPVRPMAANVEAKIRKKVKGFRK